MRFVAGDNGAMELWSVEVLHFSITPFLHHVPCGMARILVTGATGFIGLHLVEALVRRGDAVRCLVRPTSHVQPLKELAAELVTTELDDVATLETAARDIDVVFHLAGVTRAFTAEEFFRVNADYTCNLAAACAAQGSPPRFVLVSSVAAAGPAPRGQIRVEGDPPAPISTYGRSKLAGEEAAIAYAGQLPLTIVRPGIVFGPRDPDFLKILRSIRLLRAHLSPGFHPPALSFIYVSDLVELLLAAAERGNRVALDQRGQHRQDGQPGQGYYFAVAAEHPTYAELGAIVRPMLHRPYAPVIPVAAPLARGVAAASEWVARWRGTPDELNRDKIREALATNWACCGDAARRDLGFSPTTPLAQRLQQTIDWYAAHGWL